MGTLNTILFTDVVMYPRRRMVWKSSCLSICGLWHPGKYWKWQGKITLLVGSKLYLQILKVNITKFVHNPWTTFLPKAIFSQVICKVHVPDQAFYSALFTYSSPSTWRQTRRVHCLSWWCNQPPNAFSLAIKMRVSGRKATGRK